MLVVGVERFGEVCDFEEVSVFTEEFGGGGELVGGEEGISVIIFEVFDVSDSGAEFGPRRFRGVSLGGL